MTPILKTTKLKIPSYVPGFPPMFFPLVGMIALAWGSYEVFFNRLLAALIIATGDTSIPGWRFLDYKRRRAHCRKRLSDVLSSEQPAKNYLLKVLDDSAELHKKRNAILHGKLSARLYTTVPPRVELLTEARENGRLIQLAFSEDDLETLGYEIMHLAGRLNSRFETPALGLSSADTQALRELLSLVPPEDSILPTRLDQP